MIEELLNDAEQEMNKAIEVLQHQLATVRTSRASTGLVDHLQVDAYDTLMPLNQLASVSVPESRLIVIQPFDTSMLRVIEKAIQASDLGLNPQNDGRLIRLALPALTEERRRDLVKVVRSRTEDIKVSIRNHRRSTIDDLRQLEHEKAISEDDLRRAQDRLQTITDQSIKKVEHVGTAKEAEVMEV
ncbi:MAG: ribosome recycling factor [Chloroflexaceae bacterium]|nr:ribosome recycling factor [Chloroflexaceae bacterium]